MFKQRRNLLMTELIDLLFFAGKEKNKYNLNCNCMQSKLFEA